MSSSLRRPVHLLGVLFAFTAVAQRQLAPLGIATTVPNPVNIQQMAYDPTTQVLYLCITAKNTIIQVTHMSAVPFSPLGAAPWNYSVVVGGEGDLVGPPGAEEVNATAAKFYYPTGVLGWPRYAIGPSSTTTTGGDDISWVGLWIADCNNHAMRFLHFQRGNNVTLVAGSSNVASGAVDGIGMLALLNVPRNLAWGRLLRSTVLDDGTALGAWTTVVYWTDQYNHCFRQGVPLHNDTTYSYIDDFTLPAIALKDMVLNVSTFAGLCSSNAGNIVGFVLPWRSMFRNPWGIAFGRLRLPRGIISSLLFAGEYNNQRLTMVAPMYPPAARFVTSLTSGASSVLFGVMIARLQLSVASESSNGGSLVAVSVDVIIGTYYQYFNISVRLILNVSNSAVSTGGVTFTQQPGSPTASVFAVMNVQNANNVAFVRYSPNSTFDGTLVVFGGYGNGATNVLQVYCCLGAEYSMVDGTGDAAEETPTATMRPTSTPAVLTKSTTHSSGSVTATRSQQAAKTWSFLQRRFISSARTPPVVVSRRTLVSSGFVPQTRSSTVSITGVMRAGRNTSHGAGAEPTSMKLFLSVEARTESDRAVASTAAAGVVVSAIAPAAASKAAVAGRTVEVFRCNAGPAQAAVDDPQQFLSFGVSLGGAKDDRAAIVRGALVLTTWSRMAIFILLMIVAARA